MKFAYASGKQDAWYVQVNPTNPMGRPLGWRNEGRPYTDKDEAIAKVKELRKSGTQARLKQTSVTTGYDYR